MIAGDCKDEEHWCELNPNCDCKSNPNCKLVQQSCPKHCKMCFAKEEQQIAPTLGLYQKTKVIT